MTLKGSFLATASSGPVNLLLINARRSSFNKEVEERSDMCFGYCPRAGERWLWHSSQTLLLLDECLLQSLPALGWKEGNCFSFCKYCLVNVFVTHRLLWPGTQKTGKVLDPSEASAKALARLWHLWPWSEAGFGMRRGFECWKLKNL